MGSNRTAMVEGKEEKMEAEQALHSEREGEWEIGRFGAVEAGYSEIRNENALVPGYASSDSCGDCL